MNKKNRDILRQCLGIHMSILGYTYISSITPSTGAKSFEYTGPAGGGGGVAGAAGRGAAAAVRYGF